MEDNKVIVTVEDKEAFRKACDEANMTDEEVISRAQEVLNAMLGGR